MKKSITAPVLALAGGAAGAALRRWELRTAYEPDTGLPIPGAPAGWILPAVCLVFLALIVIFCVRLRSGFPAEYAAAFRTRSKLLPALQIAGAILLLSAGGARFGGLTAPARTEGMLVLSANAGLTGRLARIGTVLLVLLAVCSGFCLFFTALRNARPDSGDGPRPLLLLPPFMTCVWLILLYRDCAGNPVMGQYVYGLMACILAVLGLYFPAEYAFAKKHRPALTAAVQLIGAMACLIALADLPPAKDALLYGAPFLWLFASGTAMTENANCVKNAAETPAANDTDKEDP